MFKSGIAQSEQKDYAETEAAPRKSVTFRAVIIALLLIPLNAYWVVSMELIRYSAHPTTLSLFFNCVFILIVLTLLNAGYARFRPSKALSQGELLLIYSMLAIGTAMCGHDLLQILGPMLAAPEYLSNSTNHWNELFGNSLPRWPTVTDYGAARDFFVGHSTLYTAEHLRAWLIPTATWCGFLVVLLFVLQCINTVLRKQWTDAERLTYPLVKLPLEITAQAPGGAGGPSLVRNRLFWFGFVLAAGIDLVNALNYYYPSIPTIFTPGNGSSYWLLNNFVTTKPWNAIGFSPISFYPFVIGLGMLMPMDFLFSMWFFHITWKMQNVIVSANAWDADPQMPYPLYQSFGAYALFCVSSVYLARGYLKQVWKCALGRPSDLDDADEPLRYRTALVGIAVGMLLLIAFAVSLGLSLWLAILFFFIYLGLALAITRMRAELGTPIHELGLGPDALLPSLIGTRGLSHGDLGGFTLLFWFNRSYRCQPMPIQLEAFKMADLSGQRNEKRKWFWALLLAGAVGAVSGIWALLHLTYQFGAYGQANPVAMVAYSTEPWNRLASWLGQPKGPNGNAAGAVVFGFIFAGFLQAMRVRYPWWPFHPLGYAVTTGFETNLVWMPLLIAWVIKTCLLRYGGVKMYRASLPFFYGLMIGQFVEGSLLNIWGITVGTPTYQFWQ